MNKNIIEDIVDDIEEEKCILLLGPELLDVDDKTLIHYIHDQVIALEPDHISYYYPNDRLFLFKEESDKNRIARRVKRLYKNLEVSSNIYEKILEMPIHLIISLNADTFLSDFARQAGLPHQFSFFRYTGEALDEVITPTVSRPVFYNLVGSRTEEESLILDYEDLFKFLKTILPDGLPDKIRMKLKEANSFIFLGFDFDQWYSQLLLQLLTGERKGRPKFAFKGFLENSPTKNFLIHQFQIKFIEEEKNFFDQLHAHLKEEGLLRVLKFSDSGKRISASQVKDLIAKGNLKEAISILPKISLKPGQYDKVLVITSRHNTWRQNNISGIYQPGESDAILNKIMVDLLAFINELA